MSIPSYLAALNQYIDFIQFKQCAELAENAFLSEVINKDLLDELRGRLLRTLQEISQLLANQQGLYDRLSNYALNFFSSYQVKRNLNYISVQELQNIKNNLIAALQGLATDFPVLNVDPIDLEPIDNDEVHFTSLMGRRYRLVNIANWIKVCKAFIYPDNNTPMLEHDIEQLKRLCAEKNLSLEPKSSYIVELEQELLNAGFLVNLEGLKVHQLRENHILVLKMLLLDYQLSPLQAIAELQGLNYEQANALGALYSQGLRGEHLRNLFIDETAFSIHHTSVLKILINDWHLDVDEAVNCISGCDFDEIQNFYSMSKPMCS